MQSPALHRAPLDDPALAALSAFDIPFAVYDADGARRHVSPSALALLDGLETAPLVWAQAARLAAAALARAGGCTPLHPPPVPTPLAACALGVRVRRTATWGLHAVVVLQPHPAPAAGDRLTRLGLTRREREVARLVAAGRSTKEVAAALGISQHTARRHTERVFAKLGVSGRVAVSLALGAVEVPRSA